MTRSLKSVVQTKKNKLKRRSGKIFREIVKAVTLIITVGFIAFVMVYVYNCIITISYFELRDITVRGNERVTEKKVLNLADIEPQSNILTLNLKDISRSVETDPWIKDTAIGREFPDRLVIEVRERDPAAFVLVDGSLYIMDWDGSVFKKFSNRDNVHLPILNGIYKGGTVKRDLMKKALVLLRFLSANRDFPGMRHVSEIFGDDIYGFSLFARRGLCLQLGFGDYGRKLKRLKPVLMDLGRKNLDAVYLSIDLTDCNNIVVKRNDVLNRRNSAVGYNT
ncbi:MAG: FtsQ-type POTRA domain-containing protein [Deltaproteobacteria bacterium]|nr:FtsQ-type POTRA domain-containing protein [Deltaproteobacteria bacterium]